MSNVSRETSKLSPLSADDCSALLGGLSSDIIDRLQVYLEVLAKWQRAINLVGPRTLADPWRRHVLDSAQIVPFLSVDGDIVDLGSGAGLPGLIVAICTGRPVQMIESDQRKATFLREAARLTETTVVVHAARIDAVPPLAARTVTARALAPLPRLLPWVHRHLAMEGRAVLLKGAEVDEELTACGKKWTMSVTREASMSDPGGALLIVEKLTPLDVC